MSAGLDTDALAALLELAHDAVLVREPGGRIVYWNRGAVDLYGWTREEAVGRISHELLGTRFPESLAAVENALAEDGGWEGRLEHVTKSGRRVVVESRWAPSCDAEGTIVAALEINRDVSALAAEAARFRAFFDSSLDAMFLTAPDGRVFAANPAAVELYGYSEEEIVAGGRDLLVDRSDPRLAAALQGRDEDGRIRAQIRGRRRDGSPFEMEFTSVVFEDASGELRTSMVVRDVTERTRALQRARESEARFQALADAAFEAIFIHELGRIVAANRAACALYGVTEDELKAKALRDLVTPEEVARVEAIIATGEEGPYETEVFAAHGRIPVEVSARPIAYGGRPMRVTAMRDITDTRRAQQALEQQNERLREISALKSEFLALVSHELRTPLTSIAAYVDALLAGEVGEPTERQRRYLTIAAKNTARLRRFVEDLLFAARAETGGFGLEVERVAIEPLVREVVELLQGRAEDAGVHLGAACAAAPVVVGDHDRLVQLLDNLVSNALKFTGANGTVEVRADATDRVAVLSVSDTGPGIAPEDVPHLFERFYRGERAVTASKPGAGLGLAIVSEIAAAHDGTIRVETTPGRGSTFVVELPLAR